MQVQVRLSAGLARLAGRPRIQLEVAEGMTVGALVQLLGQDYPVLAPYLGTAVPRVRGDHAAPERALGRDEELALLVPVAGGA